MNERAYKGLFTRKLVSLCLLVTVITSLVAVSINLATHSYASPMGIGSHIRHNFVSLYVTTGRGLGAIARIPRNMFHFAAHVTNVKAFVQPTDTVTVPTIAVSRTTWVAADAAPVAAITPQAASGTVVQTTAAVRSSAGNAYAWGNCTWWVAIQRTQIGHPIPSYWGNAATWASRAIRDGYAVDHTPGPGAIMQTPYSAHGLGHVAFVESVDQDGTWHISEMNVVGLDIVDRQAEPAAMAANYSFIHDKK